MVKSAPTEMKFRAWRMEALTQKPLHAKFQPMLVGYVSWLDIFMKIKTRLVALSRLQDAILEISYRPLLND